MLLRLSLVLLGALSLLLSAGIFVYSILNRSGHTGVEPFLSLIVFGPAIALGAAVLAARKKSRSTSESKHLSSRAALFALATGLFGAGLVTWLDQTDRLVQYERWLKRGMPAHPADSARPGP